MTQREADHLPVRLWWLLGALTLAWGFNWTAMKLSLAEVPPWTFRSLCLGLGSAVLFLVLHLGGQKIPWPRGQWLRLSMLALLNITGWNILVAYGLTMIPSGRASILAYTMPALAIPLSVWLLGERLTLAKGVGLALGLVGLALLIGDGYAAIGSAPLGSLLVLGAAVSWALGAVLQKKYPVSMAPGPYTAWIMLLGGVPIFIGAALLEDPRALGDIGMRAFFGTAYNVFIAFAFAHWAWIKLATSVSVSVFSLSMLIIPAVAVVGGILFLGERPSVAELAALGLVLGSLATVVMPARGGAK
ncbi:MAG TPA: DMT family transporter [Burkholderiales bacterium]|nr:DMT family transporter [Burkholderiales bacterium]